MRAVYSAYNPTEAHILIHLLEAEGIEANMNGEHLQGSIGGIPADNYIKIFVNDDNFDKAAKITKEFEEKNAQPIEKLSNHINKRHLYILSALVLFIFGIISYTGLL